MLVPAPGRFVTGTVESFAACFQLWPADIKGWLHEAQHICPFSAYRLSEMRFFIEPIPSKTCLPQLGAFELGCVVIDGPILLKDDPIDLLRGFH